MVQVGVNMNKAELIRRVIDCNLRFKVKKVRVHKDRNYGLDTQTYSLWMVGEHSADDTIMMGIDTMPLCVKFRSMEKANKEAEKLNRWIDSTNC